MTIAKYKVTSKNHNPKIEKVEILRETAQCVFLPPYRGTGERREAKNSEWADYFDSFDEAKLFLVTMWERKVDTARRNLEDTNAKLDYLNGMRAPQ